MKQRYNAERDVAVLEAAEEDAGNAKFVFDRFKISIENKAIIDNYLLDGALLNSVNSLQVSGLGIYFLNTILEEPGLKMGQVQPLELTEKQESIRGTWNPPRSNKSRIPPLPKNLWKSRT
ncbi:hypothetical protein RO3G_05111 [Rhizopus delemar RA 99-880]|uniref:Uncharacterized protein n=1 Tax=Rhizopus delemar (strain RA 99-880 / ATCC MYA-4621 / FGSC 9543 / NRRL 43880) TaxID=246409 RepID=I1BW26_RHIO9|nr:hypothetical protein RO3G_05111 [Rhizopus delemar RA 99-880]|eukprot:EIE80406.1 hypothetical protein RO3G_05111 [Rhizopus delemar RA 99-880]